MSLPNGADDEVTTDELSDQVAPLLSEKFPATDFPPLTQEEEAAFLSWAQAHQKGFIPEPIVPEEEEEDYEDVDYEEPEPIPTPKKSAKKKPSSKNGSARSSPQTKPKNKNRSSKVPDEEEKQQIDDTPAAVGDATKAELTPRQVDAVDQPHQQEEKEEVVADQPDPEQTEPASKQIHSQEQRNDAAEPLPEPEASEYPSADTNEEVTEPADSEVAAADPYEDFPDEEAIAAAAEAAMIEEKAASKQPSKAPTAAHSRLQSRRQSGQQLVPSSQRDHTTPVSSSKSVSASTSLNVSARTVYPTAALEAELPPDHPTDYDTHPPTPQYHPSSHQPSHRSQHSLGAGHSRSNSTHYADAATSPIPGDSQRSYNYDTATTPSFTSSINGHSRVSSRPQTVPETASTLPNLNGSARPVQMSRQAFFPTSTVSSRKTTERVARSSNSPERLPIEIKDRRWVQSQHEIASANAYLLGKILAIEHGNPTYYDRSHGANETNAAAGLRAAHPISLDARRNTLRYNSEYRRQKRNAEIEQENLKLQKRLLSTKLSAAVDPKKLAKDYQKQKAFRDLRSHFRVPPNTENSFSPDVAVAIQHYDDATMRDNPSHTRYSSRQKAKLYSSLSSPNLFGDTLKSPAVLAANRTTELLKRAQSSRGNGTSPTRAGREMKEADLDSTAVSFRGSEFGYDSPPRSVVNFNVNNHNVPNRLTSSRSESRLMPAQTKAAALTPAAIQKLMENVFFDGEPVSAAHHSSVSNHPSSSPSKPKSLPPLRERSAPSARSASMSSLVAREKERKKAENQKARVKKIRELQEDPSQPTLSSSMLHGLGRVSASCSNSLTPLTSLSGAATPNTRAKDKKPLSAGADLSQLDDDSPDVDGMRVELTAVEGSSENSESPSLDVSALNSQRRSRSTFDVSPEEMRDDDGLEEEDEEDLVDPTKVSGLPIEELKQFMQVLNQSEKRFEEIRDEPHQQIDATTAPSQSADVVDNSQPSSTPQLHVAAANSTDVTPNQGEVPIHVISNPVEAAANGEFTASLPARSS